MKLYAIAVLPLFAKCNPSTYLEFKNDLIDNTLLSTEKNYVYSRIITLYDCLGIDCHLIGKLIGDDFAYKCEDGSKVKSLAGYRYVAEQDVVSSAAKIDTEIRLLEIYINNGMEHFSDDIETLFGLAYERYRFGNGNLHGEGSLSRLAKDARRDIVPSFPQFRRYFKNDENYADKLIVSECILKRFIFRCHFFSRSISNFMLKPCRLMHLKRVASSTRQLPTIAKG